MTVGRFFDLTLDEVLTDLYVADLDVVEQRRAIAEVWTDIPEPMRATLRLAGLAPSGDAASAA